VGRFKMKLGKVLFIFLFILIYLSSFLSVSNATTYVDITNTINYVYVGNVLFVGNGDYSTVNNYTTLIGCNSGTISIHIYNSSFDKTYNGVGLQYGYGKWLLFVSPVPPAGTYYMDIVANSLTAQDWSYVFNGHFYGQITISNWGQGSINSLTPSVSLTYNNNFLTNSDGTASASFNLTAINFKISSIDKVQWIGNNNYVMGIYSFSTIKLSDYSYTINVKFIKPTDGSYTIDVWASGQNTIDGTLLSMEAKNTFSVSGTTSSVPSGALVIVSPSDLYHIDLPASGSTVSDITTNFTLLYGGNALSDFGSDGSTSVSVVMVKSGDATKIVAYVPMPNTSWVYNSSTNTSMANFSYTWLHANNVSDYDVVFHAIIQSKTGIKFVVSQNTVEILLGNPASSSGNPIIDFLKHLFEDFKNWFLYVMQYLFVPNPQQMQAISLTSGGLANEMKSYLPFLDLSAYGISTITIAKLSLINNKVSDLTIDLNNSNLSGIFTFTRIATNTIISILLLLLIYEVLK
jgi:hypothetical protein